MSDLVREENQNELSVKPISIDVYLKPGQDFSGKLLVNGGPAKIFANNSSININPSEITANPIEVDISIKGCPNGRLLWDTLFLEGPNGKFEVPITINWGTDFAHIEPALSEKPADAVPEAPVEPTELPPTIPMESADSLNYEQPIIPTGTPVTGNAKTNSPLHWRRCFWCGKNLDWDSNKKDFIRCTDCRGIRKIAALIKRQISEITSPSGRKITTEDKWFTTILLSGLLGFLGIDRFYLKQYKWGIWKLVTIGGVGIWWICDFFYFCINYKGFKDILKNSYAHRKYSLKIAKVGFGTAISVALIVCSWILITNLPRNNEPAVASNPVPTTSESRTTTEKSIPVIKSNKTSGLPGTQFEFNINGFRPSTLLKLNVIYGQDPIWSITTATDSQGQVVYLLSTSSYKPGDYKFRVEDSATGTACETSFKILAQQQPNQNTQKTDLYLTNPGNGFQEISDNGGTAVSEFTEGQYCIHIGDTDNYVFRYNKAAGQYDNFIIEADVINRGIGASTGWTRGYQASGLVFKSENDNDSFTFWVSRLGWYKVQNLNSIKDLVPLTMSSYINSGPDVNRLKIEFTTKSIKYSVNNQELKVILRNSSILGYVGVAAVGNKSDVCFSNMRIQQVK